MHSNLAETGRVRDNGNIWKVSRKTESSDFASLGGQFTAKMSFTLVSQFTQTLIAML
jgi:hypothetical protein